MLIKTRSGNDFQTIGRARLAEGKVELLDFDDQEEKAFFEHIGFGTESFSVEDGPAYWEALQIAFMFSSTILLVKEPEDTKLIK